MKWARRWLIAFRIWMHKDDCPDCELRGEDCDVHYFEGDPW